MSSRGFSAEDLHAVLDRLKDQGCNILITGAVSEPVTVRATRRFLGDPDVPRQRVLVLTRETVTDIDGRLPADVAPTDEDVYLINWDARTQTTPTDYTLSKWQDDAADLQDGGIGWLRATLTDAIVTAEETTQPLDPSELRLSLDSLDELFETTDPTQVTALLRAVTALTRGVHGMGHYHFTVADDDPRIADLMPLFDARVELRQRGSVEPEQRWHVPDHGTTEWMRL